MCNCAKDTLRLKFKIEIKIFNLKLAKLILTQDKKSEPMIFSEMQQEQKTVTHFHYYYPWKIKSRSIFLHLLQNCMEEQYFRSENKFEVQTTADRYKNKKYKYK